MKTAKLNSAKEPWNYWIKKIQLQHQIQFQGCIHRYAKKYKELNEVIAFILYDEGEIINNFQCIWQKKHFATYAHFKSPQKFLKKMR